ncbi:hypothetical protein BYT27DRAFT_6743633 [Phlegmacium glaucopus]|nr:hypothetical protein BYT27DRAFT_6743633 [Phlegmacium glaucopus]
MVHSMYIYDPFMKTWVQDNAGATQYTGYKAGTALTQTTDGDNSQWGYLIATWSKFMTTEGDVFYRYALILKNSDIQKSIYSQSCSSLTYVAIGGNMPRTTPLIFAITGDPPSPTYFQAQGDGKYAVVSPFGTTLGFKSLDAIFRTGTDADQNTVEWIDLFGLDLSGNLWHTRNAAYDTGRSTAVERLSNGDICVPEWEAPSIITSAAIKSFRLATELTGAGHAYVVTEVASTSGSILEVYVQDMASTGWTKTTVASIDDAAPNILKRNVYYIELTVRKGGVLVPGLTAQITSSEFCQIDANGVSTSVVSGQVYVTQTNTQGLICLTIPANESLACPALSVWVQGMDADQTIDIQPTGDIQTFFASITVDDLKKATDQKDQSLIFSNLSDSKLRQLATGLRQAASAFGSSSQTSAGSLTISDTASQAYLHPAASKEVAFTRHLSDRHMGLISHHRPGRSFQICLKPNLFAAHLPKATRQLARADGLTVLDTITSSWGDFWTQVTNGVVEVGTVEFTTIKNGVEANITCVVDHVMIVWNGVTSFVRQVFDVIADMFRSVKVASEKIFNWLAYIFAWDDIKATAVAFREVLDTQISNAQDYMDNTARTQLKSFIGDAKTWLTNNEGTLVANSGNLTVGEYDKPESDPSNNLPSSASWLSNKVNNASKSTDLKPVTTMTDAFNSTIQAFMNNLTATGISDDLSGALQSASDFFSTLTSRGVLDGLTFESLAQVISSVVVLLLDLLEAVIDTLVDVLVQALKIFKDIVDTPIDIPLISRIFKDIIGLDLTLFNLIAVPMAVPATILYKIIMGEAPFPQSNSNTTDKMARFRQDRQAESSTKPADPLLVWSAILTAIYGVSDVMMDSAGGSPNPLMVIPKYTNLLASWFILGLTALDAPTNDRTKYALRVAVIGTVVSTMAVFYDNASRKFICLDPTVKGIDIMGTVIPVVYGLATISSGLWHIVDIANGTETGYTKDWGVVFAEVTGGIPGVAKILKFSMNPELKAILVAIDAFAYGAATIAYISASSASTST